MYITEKLREQLEAKRHFFDDPSSLASSKLPIRKQIKTMQFREAIIHSARGEVPVSEMHYRPSFKKSENFIQVLMGIQNAWRFGILSYHPEELDETFLKHLAWEFAPDFFGGTDAYFRRPTGGITMEQGWDYMAPNPMRIHDELFRNLFSPQGLEELSIPEQAIYYNFHTVRIQPFPDCNKRTGRTLQNLHLYANGYPPAFVEEGELGFYNRLFSEALEFYKQRQGKGKPTEEEKRFFEFLGSKVNLNLDRILDEGLPVSPDIKRNGNLLVRN